MRKIKSSPSSTTVYLDNLYECTSNVCTKHIFAGTRRIASKTGTSVSYYHPDHLGGMNVVTNDSGAVAATNFYYPYGGDWMTYGNVSNYKFTDQEKDPETGIYYYKARYYDPVIGRFTSPDPMLQAAYDPSTSGRLSSHRYLPSYPPIYALAKQGGDSGKVGGGGAIAAAMNSKGINPYTYVNNNPVNGMDPEGLMTYSLGFSAVAASYLGMSDNLTLNLGFSWSQGFSFSLTNSIAYGYFNGKAGSFGLVGVITIASSVVDLNGYSYEYGRVSRGAYSLEVQSGSDYYGGSLYYMPIWGSSIASSITQSYTIPIIQFSNNVLSITGGNGGLNDCWKLGNMIGVDITGAFGGVG